MKNMMMCSLLISLTLIMVTFLMTEKKNKMKEKKNPFECGFNTIFNKKMIFSTNFIMLTMMFLIFDVEIFILIPFIMSNKNPQKNIFLLGFMFISTLTILMLKEWKQGSLEWTK